MANITLPTTQWTRISDQGGWAEQRIIQAQDGNIIWATDSDPGADTYEGQRLLADYSVIAPAGIEVWARPASAQIGASVDVQKFPNA